MSNVTIKKLNYFIQFFVVLFFILFTISVSAQTKKYPVPPPWNVYIDSIPFPWPHDSTFVKDEIIIRFKPNAIILEKLCVDYYNFRQDNIKFKKKSEQPMSNLQAELASYLFSQSFPVDSLISDAPLANFMKNNGATTLHRISVASPCRDTISITRRGDTIGNSSFLWLKLKFNNDSVAVFMSIALTAFFQEHIEIAAPNMIGEFSATPNDSLYHLQRSLYNSTFDMPTAWDYTTGHPSVKIGILEAGLDYMHCDLGGGLGPGNKIFYGYNFDTKDTEIRLDTIGYLKPKKVTHGTQVTGIIGALTNHNCENPEKGVAGINGGWFPDSIGSPIYFFGIGTPDPIYDVDFGHVISALLDGANSNPDPFFKYGYAIDVFNLSLGSKFIYKTTLSEPIRHAIFSAYNNGAIVVTAGGNDDKNNYDQVSCNDQQTVINVGSARDDNIKTHYSNFNEYIDILAYGGVTSHAPSSVYTTLSPGTFGSEYSKVEGTSFAAPHITGLVSLLQSYEKQKSRPELLRPEDYEGIIKANALDIDSTFTDTIQYLTNYDIYSGWGVARAGKIFSRYADSGYAVYHRHLHDTINFQKSEWSSPVSLHIANVKGQNSLPTPGFYTVRLRRWTRNDVLLQYLWKRGNGNNVYIWGIGGEGLSHSGWDSLPFKYSDSSYHQSHYKNNYTIINSGDGGNGKVKGIIHTNNSLISASTFQYEVKKGDSLIGYFPPSNKIGINYSIYGALINPTNIEEPLHTAKDIFIQPSIINNKSTLSYTFFSSGTVKLQVIDVQGRFIFQKTIEYQEGTTGIESLDFSNYSNGHYTITLIHSQTGEVLQTKCAVLR